MILFQGTGGTIGDLFISGHIAANTPNSLYAVKKDLPPHISSLCSRLKLKTIAVEDLADPYFKEWALKQGYSPSYYLSSTAHYRAIVFKELEEWFDVPRCDKITPKSYVVVHVTSSGNYPRPQVPHLHNYIRQIQEAGHEPVFVGTKQDGDLYQRYYPNQVREDWQWRFGKDSVEETMSLINHSEGVLAFSSWSSIYAALNKIPTLELWNTDQWGFYNQNMKYLIGSPVHLIQTHFEDKFAYNIFDQHFKYLRNLANEYYPTHNNEPVLLGSTESLSP